jgi:hypothetical protein
MSHRAAKVTQADISRALRAAAALKIHFQVEICPDGTIRIISTDPSSSSLPRTDDPADWEKRLRAATGWQK